MAERARKMCGTFLTWMDQPAKQRSILLLSILVAECNSVRVGGAPFGPIRHRGVRIFLDRFPSISQIWCPRRLEAEISKREDAPHSCRRLSRFTAVSPITVSRNQSSRYTTVVDISFRPPCNLFLYFTLGL